MGRTMGNILAPFSISGDPLNSSPDSGEALAALMQCTGDAIFLLDGSTANLLCGNEAFCSLLGYKQADIAHLSLLDLVDDDAVLEGRFAGTDDLDDPQVYGVADRQRGPGVGQDELVRLLGGVLRDRRGGERGATSFLRFAAPASGW